MDDEDQLKKRLMNKEISNINFEEENYNDNFEENFEDSVISIGATSKPKIIKLFNEENLKERKSFKYNKDHKDSFISKKNKEKNFNENNFNNNKLNKTIGKKSKKSLSKKANKFSNKPNLTEQLTMGDIEYYYKFGKYPLSFFIHVLLVLFTSHLVKNKPKKKKIFPLINYLFKIDSLHFIFYGIFQISSKKFK